MPFMRPKKDFVRLDDGFDPFEDPEKYDSGFGREQIELYVGDDIPSQKAWLKNKEQDKLRMERERRLLKEREWKE